MAGKMTPGIIEARINLGLELIEAERTYRATQQDWIIYLGGRGLRKSDAQEYMRLAKRFGSDEMRSLLVKLGPSWKIVIELISPRKYTDEQVRAFFAKVPKYASDMQCESTLAEIVRDARNLPTAPILNGFDKVKAEDKPKVSVAEVSKDKNQAIQCWSAMRGVFAQVREQIPNMEKGSLSPLITELIKGLEELGPLAQKYEKTASPH